MKNNIVDIKTEKQRWNQRWRFDPAFKKDFDYEKPEYASCPDDLRWLLPLAEHQKSPEFKAQEERAKCQRQELGRKLSRKTIRAVSAQKP